MLKKLFDNTRYSSTPNLFRRKRFKLFKELIKDLPRPVKILDAGGTEVFWKMMDFTDPEQIDVTIANISEIETTLPNFRYIKADVKDLTMFKYKQFDIVFSNSVIEHVGTFDEQRKMADEIIRTGKKYFVQTPNYYFPFEPHFMFPLFQFLPGKMKVFLMVNFNLGFFTRADSKERAKEIIDSVNLLSPKKLNKLFQNGKLKREMFLLFTKSLVIYS